MCDLLEALLLPLAIYWQDPEVTEIVINEPEYVWIEKRGGFSVINDKKVDCFYLQNLFHLVANYNKAVINELSPILGGNLPDGSRIQLVQSPVVGKIAVAIRRKTNVVQTLDMYAQNNFFTNMSVADINLENHPQQLLQTFYRLQQWDAFVRLAIELKKNIVISGGTSTGKTTFLNALLDEIPLHERIITIEDAREVRVHHANQVNLLTVNRRHNGLVVNMQDLVRCALRLRPDRIIIGEIRGPEVLDFISAANTGHPGSITTIHASHPRGALQRMLQLYKLNNVPAMRDKDIYSEIDSAVDIIIQLDRDGQNNRVATGVYWRDAPKQEGSSLVFHC